MSPRQTNATLAIGQAMAKILVDGDACPGAVKDVLFKAARRTGIELLLVANHPLRVPEDTNIRFLQVPSGFDVADNELVQRAETGDLVITADIPLAAAVVEKGALAIDPRGELYNAANIRQRLNMRDFMATLRDTGMASMSTAAYSTRDKTQFANTLDRLLAKMTA